ncbi:hypothetical protein G6F59_018577 [Rhizopus arrhizus]|nr:hypothetical protein G6F59_018577 [Rhizopus arrhizus]
MAQQAGLACIGFQPVDDVKGNAEILTRHEAAIWSFASYVRMRGLAQTRDGCVKAHAANSLQVITLLVAVVRCGCAAAARVEGLAHGEVVPHRAPNDGPIGGRGDADAALIQEPLEESE